MSLGALRKQELKKNSCTWRFRLEVLFLTLNIFHSCVPELLLHPQSQIFQSHSIFRTTKATHEDRDAVLCETALLSAEHTKITCLFCSSIFTFGSCHICKLVFSLSQETQLNISSKIGRAHV